MFERFGKILQFCRQNEEKSSYASNSIDSNLDTSCLILDICFVAGRGSEESPHFSRNNFSFVRLVDVEVLEEETLDAAIDN